MRKTACSALPGNVCGFVFFITTTPLSTELEEFLETQLPSFKIVLNSICGVSVIFNWDCTAGWGEGVNLLPMAISHWNKQQLLCIS